MPGEVKRVSKKKRIKKMEQIFVKTEREPVQGNWKAMEEEKDPRH